MRSGDRLLCVVQARMGSSRLPGKVLMDLDGKPMLEFLLERLRHAELDAVVVATSTLGRDDPIAELCGDLGVRVVRGSETDVLGRFGAALDAHPADSVVRITADCPLVDPALVDQVVDLHLRSGADYTSNIHPRSFPKGLDVEVATASAIRAAVADATHAVEREHVMPFLYRHPERFVLKNLDSTLECENVRWTVDTAEDLTSVRSLVGSSEHGSDGSWLALLNAGTSAVMSGRPGLRRLRQRDLDAAGNLGPGLGLDDATNGRDLLNDPGTRLRVLDGDAEYTGALRMDIADATGNVRFANGDGPSAQQWITRSLSALVDESRGDVQIDRLVVQPTRGVDTDGLLKAGFERARVGRQYVWENRRDPTGLGSISP